MRYPGGTGAKGYAIYKCFSSGKASSVLRLPTIHSQIAMEGISYVHFFLTKKPNLYILEIIVQWAEEIGRVSQTCESHWKAPSSPEHSKALQRTHGHLQMLESLTVIMGILLSGLEKELNNERREESSFTKCLGAEFYPELQLDGRDQDDIREVVHGCYYRLLKGHCLYSVKCENLRAWEAVGVL